MSVEEVEGRGIRPGATAQWDRIGTATAPYGIVVGVDGSLASLLAVQWAAGEAALRPARLTVVHVVEGHTPLTDLGGLQLGDGLRRWREKRAADTLDAALRVAAPGADDGHRLQINGDVLVGDAVAALVGLTEQADMMVVGAHGKTTLRLGPIGSIAAQVVQYAHCPVAVIPDEHSALQRPARAPVLVGIDGSLPSQPAVAIAFEEASRRRVRLIAVYSCRDREMAGIDDPKPAAPKIVASQRLAEHLAPWQQRYPHVPVRRIIAADDATGQLLKACESAQLVIVDRRSRSESPSIRPGSVALAVVHAAGIPVIIADQQ